MSVTYEDLERDPWHGNLIRILKANHGDPLPEALKEYLVNQVRWSEVIPTQILQWCEQLHILTERILTRAAVRSDFAAWWIKVDGVFKDLLPYFSPIRGFQLKEKAGVYSCMQAFRDALTEPERLWVEHERMCHVHPIPSYYRKDIFKNREGDWQIKDEFKGLKIDDLDVKLKGVIAPYHGDSTLLAHELCKRTHFQILLIRNEVRKFRWA